MASILRMGAARCLLLLLVTLVLSALSSLAFVPLAPGSSRSSSSSSRAAVSAGRIAQQRWQQVDSRLVVRGVTLGMGIARTRGTIYFGGDCVGLFSPHF
jgi:hypothetical protein